MKTSIQTKLFNDAHLSIIPKFPSTRYQGSKTKIVKWIEAKTADLQFNTVLDAFGGTGSVSHMFKRQGKQVTYNDLLKFNYYIGLALIENKTIILDAEDVSFIFKKHKDIKYDTLIFDIFSDIYYTDEENHWLDMTISNIEALNNKYKRAIAYYALFQACISKRPYNLFHRKNLYVRTAEVARSFGNKKTWDTPFEDHFTKFVKEANNAVFNNNQKNHCFNKDIFDLNETNFDLVYIDTPYISNKGGGVDYFEFYHFLEGIVNYSVWRKKIDYNSKHRKIASSKNEWCQKDLIKDSFKRLFKKFSKSILVISYRDDGIPSTDELVKMLKELKKDVSVSKMDYKYALSKNSSKEVLIIAK